MCIKFGLSNGQQYSRNLTAQSYMAVKGQIEIAQKTRPSLEKKVSCQYHKKNHVFILRFTSNLKYMQCTRSDMGINHVTSGLVRAKQTS